MVLSFGAGVGCAVQTDSDNAARRPPTSKRSPTITERSYRSRVHDSANRRIQLGMPCATAQRTSKKATAPTSRPNATNVSYNPADVQAAYAIPKGGKGVTVAIIDAQDDPNAEADLAVYRKKFGLPACTTANGCFKKVDQNGGTKYPTPDTGWAVEISLDPRRGQRGVPGLQHPPRLKQKKRTHRRAPPSTHSRLPSTPP